MRSPERVNYIWRSSSSFCEKLLFTTISRKCLVSFGQVGMVRTVPVQYYVLWGRYKYDCRTSSKCGHYKSEEMLPEIQADGVLHIVLTCVSTTSLPYTWPSRFELFRILDKVHSGPATTVAAFYVRFSRWKMLASVMKRRKLQSSIDEQLLRNISCTVISFFNTEQWNWYFCKYIWERTIEQYSGFEGVRVGWTLFSMLRKSFPSRLQSRLRPWTFAHSCKCQQLICNLFFYKHVS